MTTITSSKPRSLRTPNIKRRSHIFHRRVLNLIPFRLNLALAKSRRPRSRSSRCNRRKDTLCGYLIGNRHTLEGDNISFSVITQTALATAKTRYLPKVIFGRLFVGILHMTMTNTVTNTMFTSPDQILRRDTGTPFPVPFPVLVTQSRHIGVEYFEKESNKMGKPHLSLEGNHPRKRL